MTVERGMTIAEAADVLRMSRRMLQEVIKQHPFYYPVGRRKMFTGSDIEKIRAGLRGEAGMGPLAPKLRKPTRSWAAPKPERPAHLQAIYDKLLKRTSKTKGKPPK